MASWVLKSRTKKKYVFPSACLARPAVACSVTGVVAHAFLSSAVHIGADLEAMADIGAEQLEALRQRYKCVNFGALPEGSPCIRSTPVHRMPTALTASMCLCVHCDLWIVRGA